MTVFCKWLLISASLRGQYVPAPMQPLSAPRGNQCRANYDKSVDEDVFNSGDNFNISVVYTELRSGLATFIKRASLFFPCLHLCFNQGEQLHKLTLKYSLPISHKNTIFFLPF